MKRILLFLMLVCSVNYAQTSQNLMLLFNENLQPETKVYVASLAIPISITQVSRIDKFVKMLKDSLQISSLSSKFDGMYLLANETSEAGLKNLVKRQHDATAVNSPTFTQWEGFTGDMTSSYLNTNYNPATQKVAYSLNSASLGVYSRTDNNSTPSVDLGVDGWADIDIRSNNLYVIRINTTGNTTFANTNSVGFFVSSRTANNLTTAFKNGVQIGSSSLTSFDIPNGTMYLGCVHIIATDVPAYFTARQYAYAFIGAGLTASEVSKLTNCIEWYMDSVNRGVIP